MITTEHKLLTKQWISDVATVERSVGRMAADRVVTNDCRVVLFEVAHDGQLHVNVTHRHQTKAVKGWSGPGVSAEGFIHNRTFQGAPTAEILRSIRQMVFAARV